MFMENFFKSEIMCQFNTFFKLRRIYIKNRIVCTFSLAFDFLENSNYSLKLQQNEFPPLP
jgi:hypothetical protein